MNEFISAVDIEKIIAVNKKAKETFKEIISKEYSNFDQFEAVSKIDNIDVAKGVIKNLLRERALERAQFTVKNSQVKDAEYTSVWNQYSNYVTTPCKVNMETKEVFAIEQCDEETLADLEDAIHDMDYVDIDNTYYEVIENENGYYLGNELTREEVLNIEPEQERD